MTPGLSMDVMFMIIMSDKVNIDSWLFIMTKILKN